MVSLNFNSAKKRILSFLLLVCMVFSVFSSNVSIVNALDGSLDGGVPPFMGGTGEGAPIGWDGIPTVKVTIVNCPDVLNTASIARGDYITLDNTSKTIAYVENATVGVTDYNTTSNCFWVGYANVLANNDLYWAVPSGGAFKLNGMSNVYHNSSDVNGVMGTTGVDWHTPDSINDYMWNEDNHDAIAGMITKVTGASGSTEEILNNYYIVVEYGFNYSANGIVVAVPPQAGFYNEANYVDGNNRLVSSLAGCETAYANKLAESSLYACATGDWTKVSSCNRSDAKYLGWNKEGYGVYIPAMLGDFSGNGALNVAVEYQGDPDTSNGTFVSDASFAKASGSSISYWDIGSQTWKKFGDNAKNDLQFSSIDTSESYSVVFADTYTARLATQWTVNDLISSAESGTATSYELSWADEAVTAGVKNVGYAFTVSAINNQANTTAIKDALGNAVLDMNISGSVPTDISSASSIIEACHKNFELAINSCTSGESDEMISGLVDSTNKITQNENFGVGIEFIVKGKPVTSKKYTITVDMAAGSSSSAQTWSKDYTTADKNTVCPIQGGVSCWVVVPNSSAVDPSTICSAVASSGASSSEAVRSAAVSAVSNVALSGTDSGIGIGLGCTSGTTEGYTVYEVIITGMEPEVGKLELPSYMLNRYFNEVITFADHIKNECTLADAYWVTAGQDYTDYNFDDYTVTATATEGQKCNNELIQGYDTSWEIEYTDTSSGTIIDYDTGNLLGRYLLKGVSTGVHDENTLWGDMTRANLAHDNYKSIDTEDIETKYYTMDYAFNLIRAAFGDKRAVSGIQYSDYGTGSGDSDDMLKIADQFGVVPKTVSTASASRNPLATTGNVLTESISMTARFVETGSNKATHFIKDVKYTCPGHTVTDSCNCTGLCPAGCTDDHHLDTCPVDCPTSHGHTTCPGHDRTVYCSFGPTQQKNYTFQDFDINAFLLSNTQPASTMTYSWDNIAYKYQTETLATGVNEKLGDNAMIPLGVNAKKPAEGKVTEDNFYRYATVHANNIVLNFYPEVKMATKIGGTEFDSTQYRSVYTMGEKLRTSESSMMYLYRLKGSSSDITGTTYSDSAYGGTASKFGSNQKVTIPAGADVYVSAQPNTFSVDLFAYGLDIIDPAHDGSINGGAGYNTVVASGADVKTAWSNGDNYTAMHTNFSNWCDAMLDIKNYAADFELEVTGGHTTNNITNFSAVVGNIQRNTSITSDMSWNLVIENGILNKSAGGYNAMISQIATDYGCTTAEAEALFEASGIYTAIINGLEASNDDFNKSGVARPSDFNGNDSAEDGQDWTNQLGGNGNWYDEKTRTAVVRRYANTGNYIKDITAVDKIDYGLAPNNRNNSDLEDSGNKQNSNYENVRTGKWYLNIFFNPDNSSVVDDNLLGGGTYHNPDTQYGAAIGSANDSYTVLVKKAPVTRADFYISAESTSGF